MARTFEESLSHYQQRLNNDGRLKIRLRSQIHELLMLHPNEQRAWLLYNRVVCLTGGARHESPGVLHDAAARFGEYLSPETDLEMRYDRVIGMVRDATLAGDTEFAHDIMDDATDIRDRARYVNDRSAWEQRTAYADARVKYAAQLHNSALSIHWGVHEIWTRMGTAANKRWMAENLLFLLRGLLYGDKSAEAIQTTCELLVRHAPDLWMRYGAPMVVPKNGPTWFDRQDVRF